MKAYKGFNKDMTCRDFQYKEGGEYEEYTGLVRKIDPIERTVVFLADNGRSAGKKVLIDDVMEIHGKLVDYLGE